MHLVLNVIRPKYDEKFVTKCESVFPFSTIFNVTRRLYFLKLTVKLFIWLLGWLTGLYVKNVGPTYAVANKKTLVSNFYEIWKSFETSVQSNFLPRAFSVVRSSLIFATCPAHLRLEDVMLAVIVSLPKLSISFLVVRIFHQTCSYTGAHINFNIFLWKYFSTAPYFIVNGQISQPYMTIGRTTVL